VDEITDSSAKTRFQEAVKKFRVPYWDWAEKPPAGEHVLPESVWKETISITFPNGTTASISNPLFSYHFHPLQPQDFPVPDGWESPYDHWDHTIHLPDPANSTSPADNIDLALARIDGNLGFARDGIYKLFKSYQAFNQFSNQAPGFNISIGNLETVHGSIHDSFQNGHMQFPTTSAFDPVFYMHHANVDRQIALWQKIYPDTYVTPVRATRQTTFTLDAFAEDPVGPDTPLHPFHLNKNGDFWTSNLVRDITKLGYTYPELMGNPSNDTLKAKVRELYEDAPSKTLLKRQDENGETYREYNAIISLPSGYKVSIFLGDVGSDPLKWPTEDNYIGSFSTKFNLGLSDDDNVLNGLVGLSRKIAEAHEKGNLKSTEESAVVEYLKANLKWKVTTTVSENPVMNFTVWLKRMIERR
jgi:tyrosinase